MSQFRVDRWKQEQAGSSIEKESVVTEFNYMDYVVEIDIRRGVIYVHDKNTGASILRVCGLNSPKPEPRDSVINLIDITLDNLKS